MKKRFKILSKFKTPLPLHNVDSIKLVFPHQDGGQMEKNVVSIINADEGTIEVDLTDFEIQGLMVGEKLNVLAELTIGAEILTVLFSKAITVKEQNERKVLL